MQQQVGLYWTTNYRRHFPDIETLRTECIESVHSHPQVGQYRVARTIKKVREVFYLERVSVHVRYP